MSVTFASKDAIGSAAYDDAISQQSDAFTPTAGDLLIVSWMVQWNATAITFTLTDSWGDITWHALTAWQFDGGLSNNYAQVWYGTATHSTSGTVTVTGSSGLGRCRIITVDEVSGWATVAQTLSTHAVADGTGALSGVQFGSALASTSAAWTGLLTQFAGITPTAPTGYTILDNAKHDGQPLDTISTAYDVTASPPQAVNWTAVHAAGDHAVYGLEITPTSGQQISPSAIAPTVNFAIPSSSPGPFTVSVSAFSTSASFAAPTATTSSGLLDTWGAFYNFWYSADRQFDIARAAGTSMLRTVDSFIVFNGATVAAASNGATISSLLGGTLNVANNTFLASMPTTGHIALMTSGGPAVLSYTNRTSTTFTIGSAIVNDTIFGSASPTWTVATNDVVLSSWDDPTMWALVDYVVAHGSSYSRRILLEVGFRVFLQHLNINPYAPAWFPAWSKFVTWLAARVNTVNGHTYGTDPIIVQVVFAAELAPFGEESAALVTNQTWAGGTTTLTFDRHHGYSPGDLIYANNFNTGAYNIIATVTNVTEFTVSYAQTTQPVGGYGASQPTRRFTTPAALYTFCDTVAGYFQAGFSQASVGVGGFLHATTVQTTYTGAAIANVSSLPTTLQLGSTSGFYNPASGPSYPFQTTCSVWIPSSGGQAHIAYTGISGSNLTGCTLISGSGSIASGATVITSVENKDHPDWRTISTSPNVDFFGLHVYSLADYQAIPWFGAWSALISKPWTMEETGVPYNAGTTDWFGNSYASNAAMIAGTFAVIYAACTANDCSAFGIWNIGTDLPIGTAGLNVRGTWTSGNTYNAGDVVCTGTHATTVTNAIATPATAFTGTQSLAVGTTTGLPTSGKLFAAATNGMAQFNYTSVVDGTHVGNVTYVGGDGSAIAAGAFISDTGSAPWYALVDGITGSGNNPSDSNRELWGHLRNDRPGNNEQTSFDVNERTALPFAELASVAKGIEADPTGIASSVAFGSPTVILAGTVSPAAVASTVTFGTATVSIVQSSGPPVATNLWTYTSASTVTPPASHTCVLASPAPTANRCLVAYVSASALISTVTAGWTSVQPGTVGFTEAHAYWKIATGTESSFAVVLSQAASCAIAVREYSGTPGSTPIDVFASANDVASMVDTPAGTTGVTALGAEKGVAFWSSPNATAVSAVHPGSFTQITDLTGTAPSLQSSRLVVVEDTLGIAATNIYAGGTGAFLPTTAAFTSPTFTPAANALVVVSILTLQGTGTATFSIADTLGGLSWTAVTLRTLETGSYSQTFYALAGANPTAGTVTVTATASTYKWVMTVDQVIGVDTSTPVLQSVSAVVATSPLALTLTAPAATSAIWTWMGTISANAAPAVTTAGFDTIVIGADGQPLMTAASAIDVAGHAAATTTWASLSVNWHGGAALELKPAAAAPAQTVTASAHWAAAVANTAAQILTIKGRTPAFDQTVTPPAFSAAATFTSPTLLLIFPQTKNITAIGSTVSFGAPNMNTHSTSAAWLLENGSHWLLENGSFWLLEGVQLAQVIGLGSTVSVGMPTVTPGTVTATVSTFGATVTFGVADVSVSAGPQTITPTAVGSTVTFGTVTAMSGLISITASALVVTVTVGNVIASSGEVIIDPTAIGSTVTFGTVHTVGGRHVGATWHAGDTVTRWSAGPVLEA